MRIEGDHIVFSSGTRVYCFGAVVGMPMEGASDLTDLMYGYDGGLGEFDSGVHSKEDLMELADHMIQRWQELRAAAGDAAMNLLKFTAVVDAKLPENVVEWRHADGVLAGRFWIENGKIAREFIPDGLPIRKLKLVKNIPQP